MLTQWSDELAAGCDKLVYFGGEGDAIGNGDYLLSDLSPLPVAATLAVFAAKTFHAVPVGGFSSPDNAKRFYLFDRDGKPLLVVDNNGSGRAVTTLNVGTSTVRITDYQGNESELATSHGIRNCQTRTFPTFSKSRIWTC